MINLFFALALPMALGVCSIAVDDSNSFNPVDTPSNVIYNDNTLGITLENDELNYTFENLYNDTTDTSATFKLGNLSGSFTSRNSSMLETDGYIYFVNSSLSDYLIWVIDSTKYNSSSSGSFEDYHFYYLDEELYPDYETLQINFSSPSSYNTFKSAIELDIEANASDDTMSTLAQILNDIVSLLTGAITNMGVGIGNGINSFVTSLVTNDGGMSIFVGVVAIFGGIALAVGLTRRIFSWVESLGARG